LVDFVPQETANQISDALREIKTIIQKPEPTVIFSKLADGKATLLVCFWIASSQAIDISDGMYALHTLLPNAELAIREPTGMA
jgi:hypothetical protein